MILREHVEKAEKVIALYPDAIPADIVIMLRKRGINISKGSVQSIKSGTHRFCAANLHKNRRLPGQFDRSKFEDRNAYLPTRAEIDAECRKIHQDKGETHDYSNE